MKISAVVCLCFLLFPLPAQEADTLPGSPVRLQDSPLLQQIGKQMNAHRVVRAPFSQTKKIKVLRRPLKSSGQFFFAQGHGVCWHTFKPYENLFIVTAGGIFQKSADTKPIRIDADAQPLVRSFTQVFLSLFEGDVTALEDQFEIYLEGESSAWRLVLLPKSRVMARVIARIQLQGGTALSSLELVESSGDTSLIEFGETGYEPASQEELAVFTP